MTCSDFITKKLTRSFIFLAGAAQILLPAQTGKATVAAPALLLPRPRQPAAPGVGSPSSDPGAGRTWLHGLQSQQTPWPECCGWAAWSEGLQPREDEWV